MIKERHLENLLVKACKKEKITIIKGDAYSYRGFPDRVIFNHKIQEIHFVELKNETRYQQTALQVIWQNIIKQSGGKYFLLNGKDEVIAYIREFIR